METSQTFLHLSVILYINGQEADLAPDTVIAQTRQVNDLNSLSNRQASYTNKFKLPKTARNIKLVDFLTLPGNNSAVPYQKNECSLYSAGTGECFVYKGWAIITDGGDDFEATIYDGIIDLYKLIENKKLSDLTLTELIHSKNTATVMATWQNPTLPYCYILADYNGNTGNTNAIPTPEVNIDYLVPSVNVAWLWGQVFNYAEAGYSGSIFGSEDFNNLWMTYPKGVSGEENTIDVFATDELVNHNPSYDSSDHYWRTLLLRYQGASTQLEDYVYPNSSGYYTRVKQAGYYRLTLSGNVNTRENVQIFIAKNISGTTNNQLDTIIPQIMLVQSQENNEDFTYTSQPFYLNVYDRVSVLMRHEGGISKAIRFRSGSKWDSLEYTLSQVSLGSLDFGAALADFSIKDFLNEVVQRFGLTMYKHKYQNNYEFRTLAEVLQNTETADWSRKFSKKLSENYIYGSYAQQNWFRYAYNDKEGSYNDSYLPVNNINLPESKEVVKSKIYSPEKERTNYLGIPRNVYKLWEKEIKDEPAENEDPLTYKSLDKRYYLLRREAVTGTKHIYSSLTDPEGLNTDLVYTESFYNLSFNDVIQQYYLPLIQVLDQSRVVTAELWLTDTDMAALDFRKLYYLEQLSSWFVLNKVSNYIPGKPTKCELVRVHYPPATNP